MNTYQWSINGNIYSSEATSIEKAINNICLKIDEINNILNKDEIIFLKYNYLTKRINNQIPAYLNKYIIRGQLNLIKPVNLNFYTGLNNKTFVCSKNLIKSLIEYQKEKKDTIKYQMKMRIFRNNDSFDEKKIKLKFIEKLCNLEEYGTNLENLEKLINLMNEKDIKFLEKSEIKTKYTISKKRDYYSDNRFNKRRKI